VSKVVEVAAKQAGKPIQVTGFARVQLGEGIDKPTTDLAAEVAATLKG
jgi:elongation factor Ts